MPIPRSIPCPACADTARVALDASADHIAPLCADCQLEVLAAMLGSTLLGLPREARALAHMHFELLLVAGMGGMAAAVNIADPIGAPAGRA
jgi:hypothetical protein